MPARPGPTSPPPPPAVQRLTIRYAKRSRMRFASHRDIARAVERGVRKAGLPVAYSAGFSPHPKISYSGGAPTGAASEAEYLEIALTRRCDPEDVRDRLDGSLPAGLDVIEVRDLAGAPDALRLEVSHWQVVLPGVAPADAARAAQAFLAAPSAEVDRLTSKGVRRFDTRAAVLAMELDRRAAEERDAGCAILRMVVRHMTPAVRPDDILVALHRMSALAPSSPPLVTRLAQGPLGLEAAMADAGAEANADVPTGARVAASVAAGTSTPGTSGLAEPAEPSRPAVPAGPAAGVPQQHGGSADQGQKKATRLDAGSAGLTCAAPEIAYEQLPRGAERPAMVAGAREPDGRDRPHARDRATEQGSN
jgi:radical SAM-linked protein